MADDPLKDSVEDTQDIAKNIVGAIKHMFEFGDAALSTDDKVKKLANTVKELVSKGADPADIKTNIKMQAEAAEHQLNSLRGSLQILKGIQSNGAALTAADLERKIVLEKQIEQLVEQKNILDGLANSVDGAFDGASVAQGVISKIVRDSKLLPEEYGKIKNLMGGISKGGWGWLVVVQAAIERWKALDKAAGEFRKNTGLIASQTRDIDVAVRKINVEMQQFGVSLEDGYAAATSLYKQFQVSSLLTKDMIADVAQMSANLGISADSSAKIMSRFGTISKATFGSATNMIKGAAALANMAGVAPDDVMRDIAEASNETLTFLAKSPTKLVAATVEARRLGTTINEIAKSSRHMLDFQTSINEELEASALLGRSVNFQTARQLAYEGDIVGARKEALKQIESVGDFTRLNVYQQEALAKAAGMTVDEVIKQQNQQKMLNALKNTDYAKYKTYMDMVAKTNADEKAAAQDWAKQGAALAEQQMRQSEIAKLTNGISSAWVSITDALLPIANSIMPVLVVSARVLGFVFRVIGGLVRGLLSPFDKITNALRNSEAGGIKLEKIMASVSKWVDAAATVAEFFGGVIINAANAFSFIVAPAAVVLRIFGKISSISDAIFKPFNMAASLFTKIGTGISGMSSKFSGVFKILSPIFKLFGSIGTSIGVFAKFLGPIGLIINAFQFVSNLMEEWDKFPDGFIGGLQAIGSALFKTLVQPFVDLWNWVSEKLMGKSPSEMGLGIVKGLAAVGGMITDVLFAPFQSAWGLIKKIPFVSKLFGTGDAVAEIQAGAQDTSTASVGAVSETSNMTDLKATVQQLTDAILKLGTVQAVAAGGTTAPTSGVEARLDELISLMKNGGIAVNMDGKRVSSTLAVGAT